MSSPVLGKGAKRNSRSDNDICAGVSVQPISSSTSTTLRRSPEVLRPAAAIEYSSPVEQFQTYPANSPLPGTSGLVTGPSRPVSVTRIVLTLLFFGGSSLGAIFVNKACVTHFRFSFPFALMLTQAVCSVVSLNVLARLIPSWSIIVPLKRADIVQLLLPTVLFVSNVSVGLSALTLVNIPMFSAFRRLTVLFVMLAEFVFLRRTHSWRVVVSVFLLASGAFVSAIGDVTFSRLGYVLVFCNNILTASYLATIKRVMRDLKLSPLGLLYYTSMLAIGPVMMLCIFTGDLNNAINAYFSRPELRGNVLFLPMLLLVAASAFCVNLSTSMCTNITSPLTTAVVGQVKNVAQSVLGFFSWGYVPTTLNVFGLIVAMLGQVLFGYLKYAEGDSILKGSDLVKAKSEDGVQAEALLLETEARGRDSGKAFRA